MSYSASISLCLIALLCSLTVATSAQDVHFSQFYNNALFLNPANTGSIERGELRFTGLQRTQWRSVTKPFNSFYLSGDIAAPFKMEHLGLGLSLMNDLAGDSRFRTFSAQGFVASGLPVGDGNKELRGGIQFGFTQKTIDDRDLRYDAQYNGSLYDPSRNTLETGAYNKVAHLDLAAGLEYIQWTNDREYYKIGVSLFNINTPNVSFQDNSAVKLDRRFNAHAELSLGLSDHLDLVPSGQYMKQNAYTEVLLGTRFRYVLREDVMALRRLYIGAFGRLQDAAYAQVGMDYDNWTVGLSYDFNLSSLDVASNKRGGLEVAVIYYVDLFREVRLPHRKCPVYL